METIYRWKRTTTRTNDFQLKKWKGRETERKKGEKGSTRKRKKEGSLKGLGTALLKVVGGGILRGG